MDFFYKYPEFKNLFEKLLKTRRGEILNNMLAADSNYKKLINKRTKASIALKNILDNPEADILFEEYSDSIYAQEIYELDAVYKQGFLDAVIALQSQNLL